MRPYQFYRQFNAKQLQSLHRFQNSVQFNNLTNGVRIKVRYLKNFRLNQSYQESEEGEIFPVLIEIVDAALLSYKLFPSRLPKVSMLCQNKSGTALVGAPLKAQK